MKTLLAYFFCFSTIICADTYRREWRQEVRYIYGKDKKTPVQKIIIYKEVIVVQKDKKELSPYERIKIQINKSQKQK